MSSAGTYDHYLRGYVNGLAKVATPNTPGGDTAALAGFALGFRDGMIGAEPKAHGEAERVIDTLLKK